MPLLPLSESQIVEHHLWAASTSGQSELPESVARLARHLLECSSEQSLLLSGAEGPPVDSNEPRSCLVHLTRPILAHVDVVKDRLQKESDTGISLGPKTSLLSSFVQTCLIASSRDVCVRENVRFAFMKSVGKSTQESANHPLSTQAHATLLAFLPLRHSVNDDCESSQNDSDSESDSESDCQSSSAAESTELKPYDPLDEDDMAEYYGYVDNTQTDSDLEGSDSSPDVSIHPAYDQHIFLEHPEGEDVVCTLVMAERYLVYNALASALHHRRILGIFDPLIALTFNPDSSSLQVVVGWGVHTALGQDALKIHVLHANFDTASDSQAGIFDLSDPSSASALAAFLFASTHGLGFSANACDSSQSTHPTSWRADQAVVKDKVGLSDLAIETWLEGVEPCTEPIIEDEDTIPEIEYVVEIPISRFVRMKGAKYLDGYGDPVSIWLMERHCFTECFLPSILHDRREDLFSSCRIPDRDRSIYLTFEPIFQQYDAATCLCWPSGLGFSDIDDLLALDRRLQTGLRADLMTASTGCGDAASGRHHRHQDVDGMHSLLTSTSEYILHLVSNFQLRDNLTAYAVPDSVVRSFVDVLHDVLLSCGSVGGEDNGNNVVTSFNQVLRMPRNEIVHRIRGPPISLNNRPALPASEAMMQYIGQDNHHDRILTHNFRILAAISGSPDLPLHLKEQEYTERMRFLGDTALWMEKKFSWKTRFRVTPATGLCDAVSLVKVPGFFSFRLASKVATFSLVSLTSLPSNPGDAGMWQSLFLPLFVTQYRKSDAADDVTAPRKLRMHLTAAVKFLAALGIADFPVFGVLMTGTTAAVVCAWTSSKIFPEEHIKATHILERNGRVYDLANPLGAFNYTAFLGYLRFVHAKDLVRRIEAVKEDFLQKLEKGDEAMKWTMADQLNDVE
ncbi:hypothetical protein BV25DRAFT_1988737 [Artomyces pyxidatus]|uniref:Uncharacterized protein n=1 Tax=Artomyces pyxidatus TaxID=48021 RepID=A0ACB8TD61_9AGAM|nr:hypothetical protein BV25DRAFT_1988737 [Artomyces pyxidatus]